MNPNPIKVFFNGKPLRDIYPHATRWQMFKYRLRKFFRKVLLTTAFLASLVAIFELGGMLNPIYYVTEAQTLTPPIPPVLQRIAVCESHNSHYDLNGQVKINATQDMGKYQINVPTWGKKAKELNLNLAVEKDNEAMAVWIYENKGTGDWSASSKCWDK